MNPMPCWTDSAEDRFPAEDAAEESLLTIAEQRIQWLCDEWKTAINDGTYDAWRDVSMMIYGASQALNYFSDNQTMRTDLHVLGGIALAHGIEQMRLFVNCEVK